jgi:hypothetical protein
MNNAVRVLLAMITVWNKELLEQKTHRNPSVRLKNEGGPTGESYQEL